MNKPSIEAIYPLSPLQRGILFHSIYDPDSRAYLVQLSSPLYGNLDVEAFKRAWQRVVERHPILRTLFIWEGRDEPLQVVRAQVKLPWKDMDWRDLSVDEQQERLQEYLQADREQGFELSVPPLMRMTLIQLAERTHQFVWTKHHLLLDGWSSLRIMEETLAFYEAFRRGQDLVLEQPRPYRDYIAWLKRQDMSGAERFWRRLLNGFSSPTPLPMQAGNHSTSTQEGSDREERIYLPAALTEALQSSARERGFTLNTLALGAWAILLSFYSGERDVTVGATVSGRPPELSGVESMVGLFINTLPVRLQVSPQTPLLSWLRDLQAQQVEARRYEYSPLVDVQGWSDVPRGTPLFRTYLVFENYPKRRSLNEWPEDGDSIEIGELQANERPNYPLLLVAIPGEQLQLRALYDSHRFDVSIIKRMLRHLQTSLESMVANFEKQISDLSFLTDSERHQVLVEWGDTESHFPRGVYIHEVIDAQAAQRPDAIAMRFEDEQVSYRELNRRSNQTANYLRGFGVGPEARVAICMDRSLELVVGLLGILKAGGAYAPLDPGYPSERLAYMLEDSSASIVLTQSKLQGRLPQSFAIEVCLDTEWEMVEQESGAAPELRLRPENLAYLLYTSGSTGKPKGVAICNESLTHHMQWMTREFDLNETDRVLQKTPFSFDASVWEFWAALMCGAELVIARPGGHVDGEYLGDAVRKNDVTILQLVPAQLRLMLEAGGLKECGSLRQVFCGGEALERGLQEEAARRLACGLCNLYGPTEATIDTIFWRCGPTDGLYAPIGRPIANTKAYLLDSELEPAPVGVDAELYIAGFALGRGYWNKPELTADRFVPDPFGGFGERMYRTGDLARGLNDGNLAYIGRTDYQVKVRGFRIELGEIEEALRRHHAVREAVAVVLEDEHSVKRLVTYVVANEGFAPDTEEWLGYLRGRLPEYMQPAACVALESIPLTPNGKIDRRALPKPEMKVKDRRDDAPRNVVEEVLCGIWSQVLGVERVGIEDNFFKLGGDSILCIQIVSRARQAGYNLAPIDLFEHQTVAELAAAIDTISVFKSEHEFVEGDVPLTPIQRRFFDQNFADPHHWNQSALLIVRNDLNAALLEQAVRLLLQHHDALRFRFIRADSGWRQLSQGRDEAPSLLQIDLSSLPEPDRQSALESAAERLQRSLNITNGPLLRMALFDLGPQEANRLLIIIHHLVVDGVSWRILLEDLQSAYDHLARGVEIQLPPKTTPFYRWAKRLQEYSQTDELKQDAARWLSSEWNEAPASIPVDAPSDDNTVASARTISVELDEEETHDLLREVHSAYHTQINDVLLSALTLAYALWSGQDSLLIDIEGHGREDLFEDVDLSRTVGWFTSVFPVRLRLENMEAGEAIKEIKEQIRAISRRGFAYGVLRYLSGNADIIDRFDSLPRRQISFNYLGQFDQIFSKASLLAPAQESPGLVQAGRNPRKYLIDINGLVVNGRLRIDWTYSENIHRRETIRNLADLFVGRLRALIKHCLSPKAFGYTPSDFPLANFDQETLDRSIGFMRSLEDVYPLSSLQQGLLFHSLYAPNSAVYFTQMSCRIRGRLDLEAFERAWRLVIDRHSILRTSFLWKGLQAPLQIVHKKVEAPWLQEDWRGLEPLEQGERLRQFLRSDRELGFDFSRAPLMRLALLRTGDDSYFFVWSSHHLLYDAWSRELIIGEVFACYESYIRHVEPQLARPRSYRDYIAWLKRQDLKRADAFWREELRGFTTPTHLGCDYGRPSQQGDRKEERVMRLGVEETGGLTELAKRLNVSLNTVVEAAWALVLSYYSGESDLVFGSTTSGRSAPLQGIESMVGLFINTLPVRIRARNEETIESFLKRLHARQTRSLEYELTPLTQIQAWSETPRGTPLFEYLFIFQNYPTHGALRERAEATLEVTEVEGLETVNYPLMLVAEPVSRLRLKAAYDAERFDAHSVDGLLGHMRQALRIMVSNADCRIGEMALMTEPERHRLLAESNDTQCGLGMSLCAHELFDKQVEKTPDAVALASQEGQISYRALKDRADLLADYLTMLGVEPETRVAVFVERSLDMVVALLAALKAGGAYVPMDTNYPAERLAYMLENAQTSVLLTQKRLLSKLPGFTGKVVCLDEDWESRLSASRADFRFGASAQNLAYVIYTSGSTGKPKGVAISHESLANYILWAQAVYLRGEELGFCLYSSLAFDLTLTSIYTPLISGNRVEIRQHQGREPLLAEVLDDGQFGVLKLTPSHLLTIKRRDNRSSAVKRLIVGGEAFESSLARDIHDSFGDQVEIFNEYGPTEATVGCMIHKWEVGQEDRAMVLIGRPAANAQIYLLDWRLNLAPENVGGELYIGGAGLARGYLGRPDLTAERFVPDPFSKERGARLYRSGDLARYVADGAIDFMGRADHQVKVRGFRIEPGEIEATLLQHPAVRDARVVAERDELGGARLVAYIVASETPDPSISSLREYLGEKLPAYMAPAVIVILDAIPLSPNGKVDLQALQKLQRERPELEAAYVAPQSNIERNIAAIWQAALNLEKVGIHDNFFDLGGHSILLIQVQNKLEELLDQEISMVELFEYPTVGSLAERLSRQNSKPSLSSPDERIEKLSKGQERLRQKLKRSRQTASIQAEAKYE